MGNHGGPSAFPGRATFGRVPTLQVQLATAPVPGAIAFSALACANSAIALLTVDAFTTNFHPIRATP